MMIGSIWFTKTGKEQRKNTVVADDGFESPNEAHPTSGNNKLGSSIFSSKLAVSVDEFFTEDVQNTLAMKLDRELIIEQLLSIKCCAVNDILK